MIIIQDFTNFPTDFDTFPEMRDLSAREQEYINTNGVSAYNDNAEFTNKTSNIVFNGVTQKISRVFLSAFHINWIVDMIKRLYYAFTDMEQSFDKMFIDAGAYSTETTYSRGQSVTNGNYSYLCIQDCKGVSLFDENYWKRWTGLNGQNGQMYFITCSHSVISKTETGNSPTNIVCESNYINGATLTHPDMSFYLDYRTSENDSWINYMGSGDCTSFSFNVNTAINVHPDAESFRVRALVDGEMIDNKIISVVDNKAKDNLIFYAICDSDNNDTSKQITNTKLYNYMKETSGTKNGTLLVVRFNNGNVETGVDFEIYNDEGTLGLSDSYHVLNELPSFEGLNFYMFVFDGTNWIRLN